MYIIGALGRFYKSLLCKTHREREMVDVAKAVCDAGYDITNVNRVGGLGRDRDCWEMYVDKRAGLKLSPVMKIIEEMGWRVTKVEFYYSFICVRFTCEKDSHFSDTD